MSMVKFVAFLLLIVLCGSAEAKSLDIPYYGTQYSKGDNDAGYVFYTDNLKTINQIYSFCSKPNCTDGGNPVGNLLVFPDKIIGTTSTGGQGGSGTIFMLQEVNSVWTETTLFDFCTYYMDCTHFGFAMGTLKTVDGNLLIGTLSNPTTGKQLLYTYDINARAYTAYFGN